MSSSIIIVLRLSDFLSVSPSSTCVLSRLLTGNQDYDHGEDLKDYFTPLFRRKTELVKFNPMTVNVDSHGTPYEVQSNPPLVGSFELGCFGFTYLDLVTLS